MKNIYLLSLLIFSSHFLQSQNFASPDASWVFSRNSLWDPGVTKVEYEKDTIIDNRSCRKFVRVYIAEIPPEPIFTNPLYFYIENGRVEFSTDAIHFDLLYNFRAGLEEKWKIYYRFNGLLDSVEAKIEGVFRTQINGRSLLSQAIRFTSLSRRQFEYVEVVHEEIGPTRDFFFPWDLRYRAVDGGEGGPLRCFHNNNLGLVQFDSATNNMFYLYDCDQIVSISDVAVPSFSIDAFPNPVQELLIVDNHESYSLDIEIFDALGRKLRSKKIISGKNEWNISELPEGVYFLKAEGWLFHRFLKT
ncbi:MAG: T9SS type A sorting domain-containing protein [Bacteroidota bacterium]